MGVKQAIKSIDAFPRAEEHLLKKTRSGALGIFFLILLLPINIELMNRLIAWIDVICFLALYMMSYAYNFHACVLLSLRALDDLKCRFLYIGFLYC